MIDLRGNQRVLVTECGPNKGRGESERKGCFWRENVEGRVFFSWLDKKILEIGHASGMKLITNGSFE